MDLYLHIGYPKTATTSFDNHLYPQHQQINYLGAKKPTGFYQKDFAKACLDDIKDYGYTNHHGLYKPNVLEFLNLLQTLSDDEFNKKNDYLLKMIESMDLSENKTNLLAYNILYLGKIKNTKLEIFLSRFEKLFRQKKINVYYSFTIRSPCELIAGLYVSATQGQGSIDYTPSDLIESLSKNKFNNPNVKLLVDGLFYYKLYKYICSITDANKIKVLVFEKFVSNSNEFIDELSEYLKIDNILTKKILDNKKENTFDELVRENIYAENVFVVLYYKIIRNLKSPKWVIVNFKSKFKAFFNLLFFKMPKMDANIHFNTEGLSKKERKNFIAKNKKMILKNKNIINKYYEEDLMLIQKELKLDLDKYNYFSYHTQPIEKT